MKKFLWVVSLAVLLCFTFACQNKAAMAELAKFKAQAKVEEQNATGVPAAPFRRVVTGFNSAGKSTITSDGPVPAPARYTFSAEDIARAPFLQFLSGNELWLFDSVPTDLAKTEDPLTEKLPKGNQPGKGGILARIFRWEPGFEYRMHTTWSVDLGIVIAGSLKIQLEEGSTILNPGDVLIQRGTPHSWRVVGDQPCVVVFVMVDAIKGHGTRPEV